MVSCHELLAVLMGVVLGHLIPAYGMFFWPSLVERQAWSFVWQLYPVYISFLFHGISRLLVRVMASPTIASTARQSRATARLAMGLVSLLGFAVWTWTVWTSKDRLGSTFIPTSVPSHLLPDFAGFSREFLCWDELLTFCCTFVWLGYSFSDLRRREMTRLSWLSLGLGTAVAIVVIGPGATLGITWLLREEIILARGLGGNI
jgi:hypothetical protein